MTFFTWCMREGLINSNVVIATNKNHEGGSRERVLSNDELRAIWTATSGPDQYSAVVRLLLLTGARRDEIGGLKWEEIDFGNAMISLPGERTKNSKPFEIPLTPAALAILEAQPAEIAHSSLEEDKADSAVGPRAKWSLTGARTLRLGACMICRRTVSTGMHDHLAVQPHIVEAVLGHISGHKGGVSGVYNKAAYRTEKAAALALWAEHVLAVAEGRPAKVVSLRA